ncbi:MAG: mercuric ion transporter MerT [Pseudohongiellaceae bacterium]
MVSLFANLVNIRSRKMEDVLSHNHDSADVHSDQSASNAREKMLATGSVIGAVIASSCCIVPLILVSLGISGTWIGSLTALQPYKPIFLSVTGLILAAGFWHVYFKPKPVCENESYCARPISGVVTQSALWIATVIAVLSATINFWAPLFY